MLKMTDVTLKHKRVLMREDLNVPLREGVITDDTRLRAVLPSIQAVRKAEASLILMAHLGRPQAGIADARHSLAPVALRLQELLQCPVRLVKTLEEAESQVLQPGEVVLLENTRFWPGELTNDKALSRRLAALCDVFVMDAFGCSHRAHASTVGVMAYAPIACAGPLMTAELSALERALDAPERPMVAVVGGAKISGKLGVLQQLQQRVDCLIVGGGMANTLIAASGYSVGRSLFEPDLVPLAKQILHDAERAGRPVPLPTDVIVAPSIAIDAPTVCKAVDAVAADDRIVDIGPQTIAQYQTVLAQAGTILWNGPLGVFEYAPFSQGTLSIAQAIADSPAFSLAGGGDTLSAIALAGVALKLSYISTGGGAFLEFCEGKILPAVAALQECNRVC